MTPAGYGQVIRQKGDVGELSQILDWSTGIRTSYLFLYKFIELYKTYSDYNDNLSSHSFDITSQALLGTAFIKQLEWQFKYTPSTAHGSSGLTPS